MRYLVLFSTLMLCVPCGASQVYTLADLRILAGESNFTEFFNHALDIKPSLRGGEWRKMTESMGLNFLDSLQHKSDISDLQDQLVQKISNWPIFQSDEFFGEKRDKFFLKKISDCYRQPSSKCWQITQKINTDYPHSLKFQFELANILVDSKQNLSRLWAITKPIAISKFGEFYCHKEPVNKIIYDYMLKHSPKRTHVDADCIKKLTPYIIRRYYQTTPFDNQAAYKLISIHKLQTPKINSYQAVIDFLQQENNISPELKRLRSDYQLRTQLMEVFENKTELPGRVFAQKPSSAANAAARILTQNFPELIRTYANKCLDYLSGRVYFPKGNPTPQCHEFFQLDDVINALPQALVVEYNKHTEFLDKKKPPVREAR